MKEYKYEDREFKVRFNKPQVIRTKKMGDYFRSYSTANLTWFLNGVETPVRTIFTLPGNILYSYLDNGRIAIQYTPAYYRDMGIEPCNI